MKSVPQQSQLHGVQCVQTIVASTVGPGVLDMICNGDWIHGETPQDIAKGSHQGWQAKIAGPEAAVRFVQDAVISQ
ncbi:hypothetical protein Dda_6729 [Drechslerella dactyloides]|uniref:Uncharacterized protein n=1 Tax=Drechslerella dactyloides TaxID=74499 RepID=A0AAD6IUG1_DREDA|nr:hypothetical protein Dda_6729 [Drechslerella dactyloides]